MLENEVSPSSVLSRVSESSSVAGKWKKEVRERVENSMDGGDGARGSERSSYGKENIGNLEMMADMSNARAPWRNVRTDLLTLLAHIEK